MASPPVTGHLCTVCGSFVPDPAATCATCGHSLASSVATAFVLNVGFSGVECANCGTTNEAGASSCHQCGTSFASASAAKSLQHKRLDTHGKVIAKLEDLCGARLASLPQGNTVVDVQQYLNLLTEGGVLSDDHLMKAIAILPTVDVSTMQAAHSNQAHRHLSETCEAAHESLEAYRTAHSVCPPPSFAQFHTLLVAHLSSVLSIYVHGVRAVFALTMEEAASEGRGLQRAVDRALEAAGDLSYAFDGAKSLLLDRADVNERLARLAGADAQFTHEGDIDLASILSSSITTYGDITAASRAIHGCLQDLFQINAESLGDEEQCAIIVMAAALQASDRIVLVKRRARFFVEALRDAQQARKGNFERSARSAVGDVFTSEADLLSITEQLRLYDRVSLSREARRMQLKDAYVNIAELVWRRLSSLLLYAMFVLEGSSLSYEDIADFTSFGAKVDWLKQRQNTRYALALEGVSELTRNAGSHGGVDVSGERIRLTNINPITKVKTEEELTDDEFELRTRHMLDTCLALRTALDVFFIENWSTFRKDIQSTLLASPPLALQNLKTVVGLWHLIQPHARLNGSSLCVQASVSSTARPRCCRDYASLCATFAVLLPSANDVDFVLLRDDHQFCRIQSPLKPFREFTRASEESSAVMVLPAMYALSITEESSEPPPELPLRYRGTIVFNVAHMMWVDVARIGQQRQTAAADPDSYNALLEELSERAKAYRRVILSVKAPVSETLYRNQLIDALGHFERGVRAHRQALRTRQWSAFKGYDKHFPAAGQTAMYLRETMLADAKIVNQQT